MDTLPIRPQSPQESVSWQRAMEFAEAVYSLTRTFPREELFGLTSQLRRAAVSIPSNIAEGQGRLSKPELARFLGIARGSALEAETQLLLAIRVGLCTRAEATPALAKVEEVRRLLNASLNTLRTPKRTA